MVVSSGLRALTTRGLPIVMSTSRWRSPDSSVKVFGLTHLGGDPEADFDGPWSLVVDDSGTLYIGDTHNRAVRRIDAASGQISTIAHSGMSAGNEGGPVADAASGGGLFTLICGIDLDRENARLLVPDWVSDDADALIALRPSLDR